MNQIRRIAIKGNKQGLVMHIDSTSSLEEISSELECRLQEGGAFFNGARVQLDLGERQGHPEEIDEIKRVFGSYGIIFDGIAPLSTPIKDSKKYPEQKETRALIVHRTLRSGQSINYHGTVVVLGDINPGAEVIATGEIVVLGKLRGVAHAGAAGDISASVTAASLEASQLRIGPFVSRSPDKKEAVKGGAEWARVLEGGIIVSPVFDRE